MAKPTLAKPTLAKPTLAKVKVSVVCEDFGFWGVDCLGFFFEIVQVFSVCVLSWVVRWRWAGWVKGGGTPMVWDGRVEKGGAPRVETQTQKKWGPKDGGPKKVVTALAKPDLANLGGRKGGGQKRVGGLKGGHRGFTK